MEILFSFVWKYYFSTIIGCSVIIAQLFGAKKYKEMKTAVYTALISSMVLCLFLMAVGLISCDRLLQITNTPENIFADSKLYFHSIIGTIL